MNDNMPVTLNMTAEDARLLLWCLSSTSFRLNEHKAGLNSGVESLIALVRAELKRQGDPHLHTFVEREYRRTMRSFVDHIRAAD